MIVLKIRNKSKEQGITLIALVITIIVLLILAGVTINLTLKEGGIFSKAQIAAKNYMDAQERELVALEHFDTEVNDRINNVTLRIDNKEELTKLAEEVNEGKTYEGETIVLQGDIDLESTNWTPIGDGEHPFAGTFDGEGHKISNLTINDKDAKYQGLFGYSTGTIKNIGIESGSIIGENYLGGIAGYASGKVENCYNNASITAESTVGTQEDSVRIGGIVGCCGGNNVEINNCQNKGKITVTESTNTNILGGRVGGITGGHTTAKVSCCLNSGEISFTSNGTNPIVRRNCRRMCRGILLL